MSNRLPFEQQKVEEQFIINGWWIKNNADNEKNNKLNFMYISKNN